MSDTSRPTLSQLVLVPAIITLGVTLLRLVGELEHWNRALFNPAGGGGGAIVGISWLPLIFGPYFAARLVNAGEAPARVGRAIGLAVLGLALVPATAVLTRRLGGSQSAAIVAVCFVALLGGIVASRGWTTLGRVNLVYGLAARVPVALLMLPAIMGKWGTHYDALPPNFPAMSSVATWALIGLFPQMTLWIGWTLIAGGLTGAITAAVKRGKRAESVATAA
jgi:hypothetical protein